ncbi:YbjN domain-containing protein [Corynebacterium variabile]|uniref:YbjN domain-containing protein n=1 Tax=Corynebacterium variabile TaxID=1727 RepID=UPI0026494F2B|nr:YbjN domain-containing protein [Corynebacterium variabile]MDN6242059.1 YbjN domain-containing protein [Corynebacterium variabile]
MELADLTSLLDAALGGPEGDPETGGTGYTLSNGVAAVVLPGEARLKTNTLFIPQDNGVRVEAFVCRAVEENHADVYRMLLQHNRKAFGVHYTLDNNSDIYLAGQFTDALTADDVQRILGQVLQLADGDFNRILERGFESSIRREWEWRLKRGESTRNLEAFQKLRPAEDAAGEDAASSDSPASSPSAATPGPGAPAPPTS